MKKGFFLSFLAIGLTSLISQIVILRELMVSFYGNEFFIGLLLATWVSWTALGSFLIGRVRFKKIEPVLFFILTFILAPIFFTLEVTLIRYLNNFGVSTGQLANLVPAILGSLILPAPLCFTLGVQFSLAAKTFSKWLPSVSTVNQIYLWETLGFVLGGILFNFWLINFAVFTIAVLLGLINLIGAWVLTNSLAPKNLWLKVASVILIIGFLILFSSVQKIDQQTLAWRFDNQKLIEVINTPHGQVAVTQIGSQYNFFESGLFLGTAKEIQSNEYLAHLALLQHPQPQNILVIGGGFNGLINEILKHPVQKITYLELDQRLIPLVEKYAPSEIQEALHDSRVEIFNLDGRHFIKNSKDVFDVIFVNLPAPSNTLINRFYTQEFFREVADRLNPDGGLLVTQLPFSPEYQNKQLVQLNSALLKTLSAVFPRVLVLPEETNIFLASPGSYLTYDASAIIARFKERQIKTDFLTENYLRYRLQNDRVLTADTAFRKEQNISPNQDARPTAYLYALAYWLTYFYPSLTNFLAKTFRLNYGLTLIIFLVIIWLPYFFKKRKNVTSLWVINMAIAGGTIMAAEIIFILLFQTIFGYLYYHLALLISGLMAGLALGNWRAKRQTEKQKITIFSLIKIQVALIIFLGAFLLSPFVEGIKNQLWAIIIFYLAIVIFGYLAGFAFPYLNYLYLHTNGVQAKAKFGAKGASAPSGVGVYLKNKKDPKTNLGLLYSADLVGAALGALLPALILLPLFGLAATVFLMMVMLASGALLLFFTPIDV